jgi:LysM repeat protein
LAFAQDNNGDGNFAWYAGMTISPQQVMLAKQQGKKFSASIAGEIHPWVTPSASWQINAVNSLNYLINTYALDGIDLNYETTRNGWQQFESSWCAVFSTLKSQNPGLVFTVAPYAQTAPVPYGNLLQACPGSLSWINWQNYADSVSNQISSVNTASSIFGGIGNVAVGFCANAEDPRGTGSVEQAVSLMKAFPTARGAFIWSFEDDAKNGFAITNALLPILQNPVNQPPPPVDTCTSYYTVKSGDSCYSIAQSNGLTVDQLLSLNPTLDSQCNLQIGQSICLARSGFDILSTPPPPANRALRYTASLSPVVNVTTKATGLVSTIIVNSSYATGYFYATNINGMIQAHLHAGVAGKNGPVLAWAFNATYGPISGSIKASFTFNPSVNNVSSLLAAGLVYFDIHTTVHPAGELRGQLAPMTVG